MRDHRSKSNPFDRRRFLAGATALGVTVTACPVLAQAQTPKRGGHLIVGIDHGGTSDSLDPATYVSDNGQCIGGQLYDGLTFVDENMQARPSLAESWEPRSGAKVWVFKIRKDVLFHNGKTVTAADIVYSINHHRGKDTKSFGKVVAAPIEDVAVTGPMEVTFTLDGPNVDFPYLLADWHLMIGPENAPFNGVGTGAFVLESFEPGVRTRVKRNPHDWRHDRGYVESVETVIISDATARISALLSNSVHLINRIPPTSIGQLEKSPQLQVFTIAAGAHPTFPMMVDSPPYENADLRLALKYAVDRETILKTVLRGYGEIGNDHPVGSHDPMFAADIPQRPYDPDKAKFHYKKSGVEAPLSLTVAESSYASAVDIAQVFQASAAKAGIDVELNRVPNDGYFAKYWMKVPFCVSSWAARPTTDITLSAAHLSTSPFNESHWKNPKFDSILLAARGELDTAKRKAMYHDLQLMLHEDGASIVPFFSNTTDAGSKKIRGFVASPVQQMSGWRAAEKVWFGA